MTQSVGKAKEGQKGTILPLRGTFLPQEREGTNIVGLAVLSIRVLENHVFLDPEIDRSIATRDVLNQRCKTASLFQFCITKQLLHRCSWPRVQRSKEFNPH